MKKILFLGGGRRTTLASQFVATGTECFFYELSKNVPVADIVGFNRVIKGKTWDKALGHILDIDLEYKFDLFIPLQDEAVKITALLDPKKTVSASLSTANICFDKLKFRDFIQENFTEIDPKFDGKILPYIIKPRFGFGSRDIITIDNFTDAAKYTSYQNDNNFIFQRLVKGNEYSVDAYFTPSSTYVDSVPRQRIRVAGGEVITSKTIELPQLQNLVKQIGERLLLVGPNNIQFIIEEGTNKPYIIEINARFGGGATLSLKAGLDMIGLIKRDWFGDKINYTPNNWKRNLLVERSYRDHYFYENSN